MQHFKLLLNIFFHDALTTGNNFTLKLQEIYEKKNQNMFN